MFRVNVEETFVARNSSNYIQRAECTKREGENPTIDARGKIPIF